MPLLDIKTVEQLARLCRIDCSNEEQEALLKDLQKMLEYMEQLSAIDTEGIPPCSHILEHTPCAMREDEIGSVMDRSLLLGNAPSHREGLILIPPVLKQRKE